MSCQFQKTSREGLYIMVFIAMLSSCHASHQSDENGKKLDALMKQMNTPIVETTDKKI